MFACRCGRATRFLWLAICAALFSSTFGVVDHAAAQGGQPTTQSQSEAQLQAEAAKNWAKLWPRLFDEPYTDGAVCSSPLLKGSYCNMRRNEFPGTLAFNTSPAGGLPELHYFTVRMTPTRWIVSVQREGSATPPRAVPGTLAVAGWPLAETILNRIGFTRERLAQCGLKAQTFPAPPLGYSCQAFDVGGIQKFGFQFVVQITPEAGTDICSRHPICSEKPSGVK